MKSSSENSILITGASGFIGKNFLSRTESIFDNIYCIKRASLEIPNILQCNNKIKWIYDSEVSSIPVIDTVIHLATSYGKPNELSKVILNDVVWPLQIFESAIRIGCKQFINIDSFFSKDIYSYEHMREYIQGKKSLRACLKILSEQYPVKIYNATLEHVYGPDDNPNKFISGVLNKIFSEVPSVDLTKCDQMRDFIYVDDAIDALRTLIDNKSAFGYEEIGIGSSIKTSLRSFLLEFKKITNSPTALNFGAVPYRDGEIMESVADIKALVSLGWNPKVSLSSGLKKVYESYL